MTRPELGTAKRSAGGRKTKNLSKGGKGRQTKAREEREVKCGKTEGKTFRPAPSLNGRETGRDDPGISQPYGGFHH